MPDRVRSREEAVTRLVELFRTHGYEGLSLSRITERTGLGKGSLFNYFPGGKEEMARAALDHIDRWFETEIFAPLRGAATAPEALTGMLDAVETYFQSGRRACLMAVFALDHQPSRFTEQVRGYFRAWLEAMAAAIARSSDDAELARELPETLLTAVQGSLLLAIALNEPDHFTNTIGRLRRECRARLGP